MTYQPAINDYFSDFKQVLEEKDRTSRTIVGYLNDLAHFAAWWEGQRGQSPTLFDITCQDVRDYRTYLRGVNCLAPPTVNRRLSSLRVFLQWAADVDLIPTNPAARIHGIRGATPPTPRWLNRTEQQRLLDTLEHTVQLAKTLANYPESDMALRAIRDRALLVLLLNTGLRALEVTSLSLDEDVALDDGSGTVFVRSGKVRSIPLNQQTRQFLAEYLALRPDVPSRRLFVGQRGPIGSRQVLRLLKKYVRHAGLDEEQVTVHSLRHSFGKNLVDAGVPLDQVAMLMGHASVSSTRIYTTTPDEQDLQRAVEKLKG